MLKKTFIFMFVILSLISIYAVNRKPLFVDYSDSFVLYTKSSSSNCDMKKVNAIEYLFYTDVFGEACEIDRENFDLEKFLLQFDAKLIFSERFDGGESYYAYSKNTKYSRVVNGKRISLQIAVSKDKVYLGSPIIYGSF